MDRNDVNDASELSPEERAMAADSVATDAEAAKLAADLEDLQQTLLRRQADFENYKKRMERERGEDSKRTTARLAESIIPIVDGFDAKWARQRAHQKSPSARVMCWLRFLTA